MVEESASPTLCPLSRTAVSTVAGGNKLKAGSLLMPGAGRELMVGIGRSICRKLTFAPDQLSTVSRHSSRLPRAAGFDPMKTCKDFDSEEAALNKDIRVSWLERPLAPTGRSEATSTISSATTRQSRRGSVAPHNGGFVTERLCDRQRNARPPPKRAPFRSARIPLAAARSRRPLHRGGPQSSLHRTSRWRARRARRRQKR